MSARHFLDTNVLIYAIAKDDPRSVHADELLAGGGMIGVQALNEFTAVARRKLGMSWTEISEYIESVCVLCPDPVPISLEIHRNALGIAQKYGYGIYGALMISAALDRGCKVLYSEDLQDGQIIERQLTIRNPFR